jgi:hypothetical protein
VAVTDVLDAEKKRGNPWNKFINVDDDIFAALQDVWTLAGSWNAVGIPV